MIIGFYLRAHRICSPQFLHSEEKHIEQTLKKLNYPLTFINNARRKAHKITLNKTTNNTTSDLKKYITLPNNSATKIINQNLNRLGFTIVIKNTKTIGDLIKTKHNSTTQEKAGVYQVPCADCDRVYVGETARSLHQRMYEHKRALILDRLDNALVMHRRNTDHNFDLKKASMIEFIKDKHRRKITESAYISSLKTIKQRVGFFPIQKDLADFVTNKYKKMNISMDTG